MNCIFRGQKRRCGEWPRGRRSSNSRFLEEASQHDCRCQEQKQERFQTTLTFKPTFQQWPIIVKQCKAGLRCWREQKLAYHHGKCTKSFQLYWLFKHCFKTGKYTLTCSCNYVKFYRQIQKITFGMSLFDLLTR